MGKIAPERPSIFGLRIAALPNRNVQGPGGSARLLGENPAGGRGGAEIGGSKPRQMPFFSGFTDERAERTWASRMRILADLGFIDIKDGPNGAISYILVWNPYPVVKELHAKGRVDTKSYNALMERMIEIGANDIQEPERAAKTVETGAEAVLA
jgi:hypothetical protein